MIMIRETPAPGKGIIMLAALIVIGMLCLALVPFVGDYFRQPDKTWTPPELAAAIRRDAIDHITVQSNTLVVETTREERVLVEMPEAQTLDEFLKGLGLREEEYTGLRVTANGRRVICLPIVVLIALSPPLLRLLHVRAA